MPSYIGSGAFYENNIITKVIIPDSVTEIGDAAFQACESLETVVIGNGVREIGDAAFDNCDSLQSVYYNGTQAEKELKLTIDNSLDYNNDLINATWYYFNENTNETASGNYWYYDNGEIKTFTV